MCRQSLFGLVLFCCSCCCCCFLLSVRARLVVVLLCSVQHSVLFCCFSVPFADSFGESGKWDCVAFTQVEWDRTSIRYRNESNVGECIRCILHVAPTVSFRSDTFAAYVDGCSISFKNLFFFLLLLLSENSVFVLSLRAFCIARCPDLHNITMWFFLFACIGIVHTHTKKNRSI